MTTRGRTGRTGVVAALAVLFHAAPLPAQGRRVAATLRDGTLSFVAHATVGDFTGTTTRVAGAASADSGVGPALAAVRGWVETPVRTVQTGSGHRERDMWAAVDAEKYPTVRLDVVGVTPAGPLGETGVRAVLHGTFALHGVTRPVDVPVTVARHGVRGLSRMLGTLRVGDVVDVRLALNFVIVDPHTATTAGARP